MKKTEPEKIEAVVIQEALDKSCMFRGLLDVRCDGEFDLKTWRHLYRGQISQIDSVERRHHRASAKLQQHLIEAAAFSIAVMASIRMPGKAPAAFKDRRSEVAVIGEAISSAREIQNFLWGRPNGDWGLEEWKRMFRKRVAKLDEVDPSQPHASVELQKRLLQTAALAVALVAVIRVGGVPWTPRTAINTNLSKYSQRVRPRTKRNYE